MQKTIKVNKDKIKLVTKTVTRSGNLMGYRTKIFLNNEFVKDDFQNVLESQKAMDNTFTKWVKCV